MRGEGERGYNDKDRESGRERVWERECGRERGVRERDIGRVGSREREDDSMREHSSIKNKIKFK